MAHPLQINVYVKCKGVREYMVAKFSSMTDARNYAISKGDSLARGFNMTGAMKIKESGKVVATYTF